MDRKKLIKKLDAVFSKFIRARDSEDGYGRCISCGKWIDAKYNDCGHYIKRQYLSTRFDEKNCNLQCKRCNKWEQGNDVEYRKAIDKKWGKGTAESLEWRKKNKTHYPDFYLEQLIETYKVKK